jgi:DNA replication protein DnaC
MDKVEFIQRMNTLQTESDEFVEIYVKKVYECSSAYDTETGERTRLRYSGTDINVVRKLFDKFCSIFFPEFKVDDSNKKVIDYLLNMGIYKTDKNGLIIRGNIGSGKTLLAMIYIHFIQNIYDQTRSCRYFNPISISAAYSEKGFEMFGKTGGYLLFIDDMGINTENNHYGNKINVIENLIYARYAEFKNNPHMQIICTTNLIYKDMLELYGERAMSRLSEMADWNEGVIIGNDRRKLNPLKIWPKNSYLSDGFVF